MGEFLAPGQPNSEPSVTATNGEEREEERFDMGKGVMMTQREIDEKFEQDVRETKGPMADFLIHMSNEELRRSVVKMNMNEPTKEQVEEAMDRIRLRVANYTDDNDHSEKVREITDRVVKALDEDGKVVAFQITVKTITPDAKRTRVIGGVGGTVVGLREIYLNNVESHIDALSKELDLPWEEALKLFVGQLRDHKHSQRIDVMLKMRSANGLLEELSKAGKSPEDDPGTAQAVAICMREASELRKSRKSGDSSAESLEGLLRLKEMLEQQKEHEEHHEPGCCDD